MCLITLNFHVITAVSEKHYYYYYYYYYFRLQNLFQECKFIISPSVATMMMKLLTNDIFILTFNCDEIQQWLLLALFLACVYLNVQTYIQVMWRLLG